MIQCRDLVNTRHLPADDEHSKRFFELLEKIAKSPSANVSDLAAQARTLEYVLVTWGSDWDGYQDFARTVREGAERLAEPAAT